MGKIGIFPTREHDTTIMRDIWRIVRILFVRQLANFTRLTVVTINNCHRHITIFARKELVCACTEEHNLILVRQVAAIPPHNILMLGRRNFKWLFCARSWNFVNTANTVRSTPSSKENTRSIPVKINILNERGDLWLVKALKTRRFALEIRKLYDIVLDTLMPKIPMVMSIDRKESALETTLNLARLIRLTANTKNLIKIDNRIFKHCIAIIRNNLNCLISRNCLHILRKFTH